MGIPSQSERGLKLAAMEVGRICVKNVGRESGKKCVIIDIVDKNFVFITGPKAVSGIKRRRANVNHVEPTQERVDINRGATDEEITEALKAAGKLDEVAGTTKPVQS